jgi:L-lactate dehydrogenase complex protein LldG
MSAARSEILARVQAGLRAAPRPPLPPPYRASPIPAAERVARFTATLERVGGRVHPVRSLAEACATAARLLGEAGARRLVVSDAPEARVLAAELAGLELLEPSASREALFAADAGLTTAQWGIAETGTLVLESARERHRLASLVVPLHLALLRAEHLLGTLGEALAAVRAPTGLPASRTITFVTGPSRTADIELELVVGVHGPKSLHVLLFEAPA